MAEALLLNANTFTSRTEIGPNFPEDDIKNAVLFAQRSLIKRRLGKNLYDRFITEINSDATLASLPSAYKTLLDDFITDLLVQTTYHDLLEVIYIRPSKRGFVQPNSSPQSTAASSSTFEQKRYAIEQKIDFYEKRLVEYLIDNKDLFPELTAATNLASDVPDLSRSSSTQFIYTTRTRSLIDGLRKAGVNVTREPGSRFDDLKY